MARAWRGDLYITVHKDKVRGYIQVKSVLGTMMYAGYGIRDVKRAYKNEHAYYWAEYNRHIWVNV